MCVCAQAAADAAAAQSNKNVYGAHQGETRRCCERRTHMHKHLMIFYGFGADCDVLRMCVCVCCNVLVPSGGITHRERIDFVRPANVADVLARSNHFTFVYRLRKH